MRLDAALAVYVGETAVTAIYVGSAQVWLKAAGPVRTKTATLPLGVVLGGHSSLTPSNDSNILGSAVGTVQSDFGQSSQEVWGNNGPARTGSYNMLIVSESDSYSTLYEGIPHPDSPAGVNNLQHLYWLGLEAKDRGAEFVLFNSPSATTNNVDAPNRQRMNYYRQWLQTHLDMPVWLIPGELYVQELRDRGLTNADIFADVVHLRGGAVSAGAAWQAVAFVTGALPAGATGVHAEAALASVQRYWWAGLGGSEFEAGLQIPDPLPSPLPRPGTQPAGPSADITWTATDLVSPVAPTGATPAVVGGNLRFTGNIHPNHPASFPIANAGFYAVLRLRASAATGLGAIVYANPNPADIFVDPYTAGYADLVGGNIAFGVERWPEGVQSSTGLSVPNNEWATVEFWSIGTEMGACLNGGAEFNAPSFATAVPTTSNISLFQFWDGSSHYDVSRLAIRTTMPTAQERADLRAWVNT